MEFFLPAVWRWKLPTGVDGVAGAVLYPARVDYESVMRRKKGKYPHHARRLLDPQMYLAGLEASTCRSACSNLASFGWFPMTESMPFDSGVTSRKGWRKQSRLDVASRWLGRLPTDEKSISLAVERCLAVQLEVGVEALVLPGPLTLDASAGISDEMRWLDRGIAVASRLAPGVPRLATVAISDCAVFGRKAWELALTADFLDGICARDVQGAYIVIEQTQEDSYYLGDPGTIGTVLRLCYGFRQAGCSRIVVAGLGTAGPLALAAGADTWVTGWYRSERRIRRADFGEGIGAAYPTYYSQPFAGEFHLDSDLDAAVSAGLLDKIADETRASQPLIAALRAGRPASSVADWEYRKSNVPVAMQHFFSACLREVSALAAQTDDRRRASITAWLANAVDVAKSVYALPMRHPRTSTGHQAGWLKAFSEFVTMSDGSTSP